MNEADQEVERKFVIKPSSAAQSGNKLVRRGLHNDVGFRALNAGGGYDVLVSNSLPVSAQCRSY